jgi:tetratricopeptide (TPR) repeat protein
MGQPMPPEGPDGPGIKADRNDQSFDRRNMRAHKGMPGAKMRKPKRPNNPEIEKFREQKGALQAIAEAHKELAQVYESQNKIDEAAAELKKITELFEEIKIDKNNEQQQAKVLIRKTIPVYQEISRLYLQNNRVEDAETILLEGIKKFEEEEPQAASKLILQLSQVYKANNKLDKAEEILKKLIALNKKLLKNN